jgi:hypothetical protein
MNERPRRAYMPIDFADYVDEYQSSLSAIRGEEEIKYPQQASHLVPHGLLRVDHLQWCR